MSDFYPCGTDDVDDLSNYEGGLFDDGLDSPNPDEEEDDND